MYPSNTIFPVYCRECWYSDKWNPMIYGIDYNFSKPFFEQFQELSKIVPRFGIFQRNVINSDYSNMVGESRNVYLSISIVLGSENIFYSWGVDKSFNIFDSHSIKESDSLYENIECEKNYNCQYLILSRNCMNSYFLIDCINCNNCMFSFNLRNKRFYIYNKQYSRENYFNEIKKLNLGSRKSHESLIYEFEIIKKQAIYRFANIIKSIKSTGDNLLNVKNCINCFNVHDAENLKNIYRAFLQKDSMDIDYAGKGELMYEYITGALNDYNVKFSYSAFDMVQNVEYIESCISSSNLFGCISIKNKENIILNKQYTKEEYEALVPKIIQHMNDMPYVDKKGRIYKYGEFFPAELSSFAYNETIAQEYFPLTKEEVLEQGYKWADREARNYKIEIENKDIPDHIKDVAEDIENKVIACEHGGKCKDQCTEAFKIIHEELSFYKRMNIPLPRLCPNCRHYQRLKQRNPLKLWHRRCQCAGGKSDNGIYANTISHLHGVDHCPIEFETSYSPDRPEIVYCEKCYQQEVY